MQGKGAAMGPAPVVTPRIASEAAVWIARLHGPDRSKRMERECLAWQAQSDAHRLAFERCTDTWQDVAGVTLADAYAASRAARRTAPVRPPLRARWLVALTFAAIVVGGGAVVMQPWRGIDPYSTGVGEQRMVLLGDGTRLSLNTSTRVQVDLGAARRVVNVEDGEALFEVAKDANRPFIVRVAGSEVVALGTVFAVRLAHGNAAVDSLLTVTLIEGQVTVQPAAGKGGEGATPMQPLLMWPGDRVRVAASANGLQGGAAPQVDRPRLDQVAAWKRNEAVFDDVPLSEAVAEMNRYSRTPVVLVGDAGISSRRISGLFHTGNNAAFAQAVAALQGLVVREREGRLELSTAQ